MATFSIKIRMHDERRSLLACFSVVVPTAFATAAPHWEYSGEAGPAKWASLTPEYGQCAGSQPVAGQPLAGLV